MMLLPCPHCGPRNVTEFSYRGTAKARPVPATTTPDEWRRYLYTQPNRRGWDTETWYHQAGCRKYFTAERDTLTNEVRTP